VPFTAKDFYQLALWIVEQKADEASFRTAIGRAYYATHLLAVEKAQEKKGFQPKGTGDDHMGVIRALNLGTTNKIANRLRNLLELRQHADYHLKTSDDVLSTCPYCGKLRRPLSTSVVEVTQELWEAAKDDAEELLRRLQTM
jgi:hypothetical protein